MRTPDGKVTFKKNEGYYDRPISIACGRCKGCRLERARQWAVRCMHEAQFHDQTSFITLTYDKENLPRGGSLEVEDWKKFAKRLRKNVGPFRYFHCGEYTDDDRPHYHALLFGQNFQEDRTYWKTSKSGFRLDRSPTLEKLWPQGFSTIGELTLESAAYVARYSMKKINGDEAEAHYTRIGQEHEGEITRLKPEYTTMSLKPGIGAGWIAAFNTDIYPADFIVVKGKKQSTTKYYDNYIKEHEPAKAARIHETRVKNGRLHAANRTRERLAVRERVADAKQKLYSRDL